MASLRKRIPSPNTQTFVYAKKALGSILLPKSLCLACKADRLVLKNRLKVLLTFGQNLVLLLALQVGQLRNCLVDDLERGLDLFLGDDKRRCQTDDVLVSGLGL